MRRFVVLTPMLILILASCLENGVSNPPLEVRFQLLNSGDEPTTVFQEGEDILFDYSIVNLMDETVTWYFDSLFNYKEMFTVYKIEAPKPEMPEGGVVNTGPPQTPQIQRDARLGRIIPAEGEMRVLMSWLGDRKNTYMFDNWQINYHGREPF